MPLAYNYESTTRPNVNLQRVADIPERALASFTCVNGNTGASVSGGQDWKSYVAIGGLVPQFQANRYYGFGFLTDVIDVSPTISEYSSIGFNNQKITTIARMDGISVNFSALENPFRVLRGLQNVFARLVICSTVSLKGIYDVYVYPVGKFAEPDFDLKAEFQSYPIKYDATYNNFDYNMTALELLIASGLFDASKVSATDECYMSIYNDSDQVMSVSGVQVLEVVTGAGSSPPNPGADANLTVLTIPKGSYYGMARIALTYASDKTTAGTLLP